MMGILKVVYACGSNGEFGYKNGLPWPHDKDDLANFKRETQGTVLIMGVNTFRSLPSLLPGREHVVVECRQPSDKSSVVAKNGDVPDVVSCCPVQNAIIGYMDRGYDVSVIGGSDIISRVIGNADMVVETEFHGSYPADVYIKHDRNWLHHSLSMVEETKHNNFTVRRFI